MALRGYHVTMRRTLVVALLVLLISPVLASGAGLSGGVRGTVKQAAGGACLAEDPCDGIGRNVGLVFSRAGQPAHRVRSNGNGGFRVLLAPGRYTVRATVEPATRVSPSVVTVPREGFFQVTLVVGDAAHRISTPGR